jgi:hypothetical protein
VIATVAALLLSATAPKPKLLVVDGLIIGQYMAGKWKVPPDKFGEKLRTTGFHLFGVGTRLGTVTSRGYYEEVTGGSYIRINPELHVAVSNVRPTVPRSPESFPTTSSTYQKIADDFNRAKGLPTPVKLKRIFSVDLDGDGTKEVLLEARNFENTYEPLEETAGKVTYSWVLLRHITKSVIKQTPLEIYHSKQKGWTPPMKRLRAVADIDGDGRMEIVTSEEYHEGQGGSLWKYNRGKLNHVVGLTAGV